MKTLRGNELKVCFITTIQHNPGDDFVREGIAYLIRTMFPSACFTYIHKHIPSTANPLLSRLFKSKLYQGIPRGLLRKFSDGALRQIDYKSDDDKVLNADVLIQSGAPVYWLHEKSTCARNEWYSPIILKRWLAHQKEIPLLNIGAGTCQAYDSTGEEFLDSPDTVAYIQRFFDYCSLTTVRDTLSNAVLEIAGRQATLLPCPSVFARFREQVESQEGEYIALNFMPLAGHYILSNNINSDKWVSIFTSFAKKLSRSEKCILICHNKVELASARKFLPEIQAVYFHDYREYLEAYSRAKFGILNRVHGAYALASFGKPSAIIGTDSRARMANVIGLDSYFSGDISEGRLEEIHRNLVRKSNTYPDTIHDILHEAKQQYVDSISKVLM